MEVVVCDCGGGKGGVGGWGGGGVGIVERKICVLIFSTNFV